MMSASLARSTTSSLNSSDWWRVVGSFSTLTRLLLSRPRDTRWSATHLYRVQCKNKLSVLQVIRTDQHASSALSWLVRDTAPFNGSLINSPSQHGVACKTEPEDTGMAHIPQHTFYGESS
jgi:hypothetical protein